jgi:hypothetical protein
MEGFQDEGAEFAVEDVERVIREAIKATLHDATYNPKKVNEWTNLIVATCLKSLQDLSTLTASCLILFDKFPR